VLRPYCEPCKPHRWTFMALPSLAPRLDLAGDFTMTVAADPACTGLPDELRTRSYQVSIVPASDPVASFSATASGERFLDRFKTFGIFTSGEYVFFELGGLGYGPVLIEEPIRGTYLSFDGVATGTVATPESSFSIPLAAVLEYCTYDSPLSPQSTYGCKATDARMYRQCESTNHRLTLTRRNGGS